MEPVGQPACVAGLLDAWVLQAYLLQTIFLSAMVAQPSLVVRVIEGQSVDPLCQNVQGRILSGKPVENWHMSTDGALRYSRRLFVPLHCRDEVLREFHHSRLAVHPRGTKMYRNFHRQF